MRAAVSRWYRVVAVVTALVLMIGAMGSPVSAAPAPPGECPSVLPQANIHEGQHGTGWTVTKGHTRKRFHVEVLGILPNGINPGHDLVLIKVSDVPGSHFIQRAGGIWAGISGSPVYINGRLAGSVSWGFTAAPSPIGGMTPAEDIVKVLDYSSTAAARQAANGPDRIPVPASMRSKLARAAGVSEAQATSFERLRIPMAVSGLSVRGRDYLQRVFDKAGLKVVVTSGGTASAPTPGGGFARPVPGGNFAGMLSYGDLTAGGVGTTTYVCGGQALAFGHPLTFTGPSSFGASDANALAIVKDSTFGSFKMANIGAPFGVLDQDRLSGIRAQLGVAPSLIPVIAHVKAVQTGHERTGETDVTSSRFVPGIAPAHLFFNIDTVYDQVGPGSTGVHWIVRGRDSNGDPWSLERTNRFASLGDISFESALELNNDLFTLFYNPFEDITFTRVDIDANVTSDIRALLITKVQVSKNGGPFHTRQNLNVHPGDNLTFRATLQRYHAGTILRDVSLTVPSDASGSGTLAILGGANTFLDCGFSSCGTNFSELVQTLRNAPRNNDLVAQLILFGLGTADTGGGGGGGGVVAEGRHTLGGTVSGEQDINVNITP